MISIALYPTLQYDIQLELEEHNEDFKAADGGGKIILEITIIVLALLTITSCRDVIIFLPIEETKEAEPWTGTADTSWYSSKPSATTYKMEDAESLAGLAALVNNGTEDFAGRTIVLTTDLDLSGISWNPIGTDGANAFAGKFDGRNHTITGLSVTNTMGSEKPENAGVGFFGVVKDNAEIKNLNVSGKVESNSIVAGGIVGRIIGDGDVVIENCTTDVDVTSNNSAAGAVGLCWGNLGSSVTITDVHNTGAIKATGTGGNGEYSKDGKAGGIVGALHSYWGRVKIENCTNTAPISGGTAGTGGIVGYAGMNLTINSCENSGDIGSNVSKTAGGMIGRINSGTNIKMSGNTNSGDITAYAQAGGILGSTSYLYYETSGTDAVDFSDPEYTKDYYFSGNTNSGNITIEKAGSTEITVPTECYAGGIIGDLISNNNQEHGLVYIDGCTSTGNVSATEYTTSYAGGIVGRALYTVNMSKNTVASDSVISAGTAAGAIVGHTSNARTLKLDLSSTNERVGSLSDVGEINGSMVFSEGTLNGFPVAKTNNSSIAFAAGTSFSDGNISEHFEAETTYSYNGSDWVKE